MAERSGLPRTSPADELRLIIAGRRRRRRHSGIATLAALAAIPLGISASMKLPIMLVWNASASAPIGLYYVSSPRPARRNDMVIAWTPEPARTLAARRHYLPANVPLVKRVAAARGDEVCAHRGEILINGLPTASRRRFDPAGRPMPWWSGCRRLKTDEFLLLMDKPASFDGRYFGITNAEQLVGKAEPIWPNWSRRSDDG